MGILSPSARTAIPSQQAPPPHTPPPRRGVFVSHPPPPPPPPLALAFLHYRGEAHRTPAPPPKRLEVLTTPAPPPELQTLQEVQTRREKVFAAAHVHESLK